MDNNPEATPIDDSTIDFSAAEIDQAEAVIVAHKHPMPAFIKFGIPAFILLVIVAVVVTLTLVQRSSEASVEPPVKSAVIDDIAVQQAAVESPLLQEQDLVDKASFVRLEENFQVLEQKVLEALSQFTRQRDAAVLQNSRIQEVLAEAQQSRAQITDFSAVIDDLNKSVEGLAVNVDKNSAQLLKAASKPRRKTPPRPVFELLSIDQWGERDSVILEHRDLTRTARVGDVLAGWSIQSVNRPCIELVRLSDQVKAQLCLKERAS